MNGKELVETWYEVMWNRWDESVHATLLAPDVTLRGSLGEQRVGRAGVADYMALVRAAFPDFENEIRLLIEEPPHVFARLRYTGTHRGRLFDIEPTGRRVSYSGAAVFRIEDGKIADVWVLGDRLGLLEQLRGP